MMSSCHFLGHILGEGDIHLYLESNGHFWKMYGFLNAHRKGIY